MAYIDSMDDNPSQTAFVERAYRETLDLLVELRDYMADDSGVKSEELKPEDRLQLTYELSRVTRSLTNVMAWLLLQKAVIAGEMTAEEAAADPAAKMDFRLDDAITDDPAAQARLPIAARGMFDRGRRLVAHVRSLAGENA